MKKAIKRVPSEVYSKEYYAKINDGGAIFDKHAGKIIPRRMKVCVKLARIKKDDVVLDFGCGRGDLVFYLSDKCHKVTGVDYSKSAINICKNTKEKHYKKSKNITFYQSTVSAIQLADNSVDKIFLIDVVEHLYPAELNLLLNKLYKILKKDGILIIHTAPNLNFYRYGYPIIRLFYPIIRRIAPLRNIIMTKPNWKNLKVLPKNPEENSHNEIGHVNEMTPKRLKRILNSHKFHTRVKTYPFLRDLNSFGVKMAYAVLSLPIIKFMFSADIVAIAKK